MMSLKIFLAVYLKRFLSIPILRKMFFPNLLRMFQIRKRMGDIIWSVKLLSVKLL